jgi:serine/threonine protein kinase
VRCPDDFKKANDARREVAAVAQFDTIAELAESAEAKVYLVRDASERNLVLKLYRQTPAVDVSAFSKLRAIQSRHVVQILDVGVLPDGGFFEILEHIPEGDLSHLYRTGPVSSEEAAEVIRQIAEGLEHLHAAGVVHGDLSPRNVLIRSHSPLDVVLTDFGTHSGTHFMTPGYSAPEKLSGRISSAGDWWALGMIARELVTGSKTPFGADIGTYRLRILTESIDLTDIPDPRMRLLCRGLLTRDPTRRWNNVQVREWLAGGTPPLANEGYIDEAPDTQEQRVGSGDHERTHRADEVTPSNQPRMARLRTMLHHFADGLASVLNPMGQHVSRRRAVGHDAAAVVAQLNRMYGKLGPPPSKASD